LTIDYGYRPRLFRWGFLLAGCEVEKFNVRGFRVSGCWLKQFSLLEKGVCFTAEKGGGRENAAHFVNRESSAEEFSLRQNEKTSI